LLFVSLNILLGFFNKYSERDGVWFSEQDELNIRKQDEKHLNGLSLLDTTKAFVVGKFKKKIRTLEALRGNKLSNLSFDQQFDIYTKHILPIDFKNYWSLVDETGNNTSERILSDYYEWQYPDYHIYIYIPDLFCANSKYPAYSEEELTPCFISYGEKGRRRDIDAIGRVFKASGGWPVLKDRLYKFYKAVEEYFFPTYVRRDLMNDPYFLIERGQYKEARAGLPNLPPDRRAFCETKLKALGK
jgi:hypothetical protein